MDKIIILLEMLLGSAIGGYIPSYFGASMFSVWSILGSAAGGVLGIWLTFKTLN